MGRRKAKEFRPVVSDRHLEGGLNVDRRVTKRRLTLDNCRKRREGFGGPEINGSVNIPPSIVKSPPGGFEGAEGFIDFGRNLQIPPFGSGSYRL